jgi:hypothetical protein
VRIFTLKAFARFQRRERIADAALVNAVRDASAGLVDADLGGGIIKQRVPRAGKGKSGGFRTLVAYRRGSARCSCTGLPRVDERISTTTSSKHGGEWAVAILDSKRLRSRRRLQRAS